MSGALERVFAAALLQRPTDVIPKTVVLVRYCIPGDARKYAEGFLNIRSSPRFSTVTHEKLGTAAHKRDRHVYCFDRGFYDLLCPIKIFQGKPVAHMIGGVHEF